MVKLNKLISKLGLGAIILLLLLMGIANIGFSDNSVVMRTTSTVNNSMNYDNGGNVGSSNRNLCNGFVPCTCGDIITVSKNLTSDGLSYCEGKSVLSIKGDNIVLNCNGKDLSSLNNQGNVLVVSGNNITIENCVIHDGNEGILLNRTTNFVIKNSKIYNNYASGIYVVNSKKGVIENNTIQNNWDGVFLLNSSFVIIKGNSITHNKVDGVQLFYNTYKNTIINNNLTYNDGHGYAPVTCDNVVKGNIAGKGLPILYISNKKDVNLHDLSSYSEIVFCNVNDSTLNNINIFNSEMKTDGILLVNSNNNQIENSKLRNVRAGIYLYHSSNNRIVNINVLDSDFGVRLMKESNKNEIDNCVLKSNSVFIRLRSSYNNDFSNIMINGKIIKFTPVKNYSEIKFDSGKISYFNVIVEGGKKSEEDVQKSYVEKSYNSSNFESNKKSGFTWVDYLLILIFFLGISFSIYFLFLRK